MPQQKLVKVGGVWKSVSTEFVKVGGVWKTVTSNYVKIGGTWKAVVVGERQLFVTEQAADRAYSLNGELVEAAGWPVIAGVIDNVEIAADSSGFSYWACGSNVVKIDEDGAIVWTYSGHGTTVKAVCVDAAGFVYSGDIAGTVKKLTSAGAQVWTQTINAGYWINAICVDYTGGEVYVVTGQGADRLYRLHVSNGVYTQIPLVFASDGSAICWDWQDGRIIVGDTSGNIRKVTTGGAVVWTSANAGSDIHALSVGHDGFGYCAMGASRYCRKFVAATGAPVWSYRPATGTACCNGITADLSGYVYATYQLAGASTENVVRKISSAGALVSTWQPYTSAQMFGICSRPGLKSAGM